MLHFAQWRKQNVNLFSNFSFVVNASEQFMSGLNVNLDAVELHCQRAELLFVGVEHLQRAACHHLEPQQLLVPLVDLLNILLILNLELAEVHLMKHLSHLLFLQRVQQVQFVGINISRLFLNVVNFHHSKSFQQQKLQDNITSFS